MLILKKGTTLNLVLLVFKNLKKYKLKNIEKNY